MILRAFLLVVLGAAAAVSGLAQAQQYRWVDQNGRIQFTDTPPPPGGIPTSQMKVLLVDNWEDYMKSRPQFVREWDKMMGIR